MSKIAEINSQHAYIVGLYPLRKQPFIAIATQDNVISIYHTGTEQRLRILKDDIGNKLVAVHPDESVIACSDGHKLATLYFYETTVYGQNRGWWRTNQYQGSRHQNGTILDLDFNTANMELVVILSNGEIIFCNDRNCCYQNQLGIITNFNVSAYDFRGCICSEDIRTQLKQNGALI